MAKEIEAKSQIRKALQGYKALRSAGITVGDICKLVNWDYAKKLAKDSGLWWLQVLVTTASSFCLIAPGGDKFVDNVVKEIETQLV